MSNGTLDVSTLAVVPGHPGVRLLASAAEAWVPVRDTVEERHGWRPRPADGYRDVVRQERIFRERYTTTVLPAQPRKVWRGVTWYRLPGMHTASVPGRSNHGLGTTVDVAGLGGFGSSRFAQFAAVAQGHGWDNREGAGIGEAWHWTHAPSAGAAVRSASRASRTTAAPAPTDPPEEDDEMQERALQAAYRTFLGRLPTEVEVDSWLLGIVAGRTLQDQVNAIARSPEARWRSVSLLYAELLGRRATQDEAEQHLAASEGNLATIRQAIAASAEAAAFAALPAAERAARTAAAQAPG